MRSDGKVWAEQKISRRGRWYQLKFEEESVRESVEPFVREVQPNLMTSHLVLGEGQVPFVGKSGASSIRVEQKSKAIVIGGGVEIELGGIASIEKRFSVERFRDWLATASISHVLPPPVFSQDREPSPTSVGPEVVPEFPRLELIDANREAKSNSTTRLRARPRAPKNVVTAQSEVPSGFSLLTNFITEDEERHLLATIDNENWDDSMTRRVQHYGWKYDYKARKIDPSSRIGPLPIWLQVLATRLMEKGIFKEMPDQVIVNNYVGPQSISKHVDCVPCFRGPVVTISLNEAWEMLFAPKGASEDLPRFSQVLPRRSAAVLDGEVRLNWTHEIPRRKREGAVVRGRRVSITFRKVNVRDSWANP